MLSIHFIARAAWGGWGSDDDEDEEKDEEKDSRVSDLTPTNTGGNSGTSGGSSWNGPASVSSLDREVFDVTNRLRTDPQSFIP